VIAWLTKLLQSTRINVMLVQNFPFGRYSVAATLAMRHPAISSGYPPIPVLATVPSNFGRARSNCAILCRRSWRRVRWKETKRDSSKRPARPWRGCPPRSWAPRRVSSSSRRHARDRAGLDSATQDAGARRPPPNRPRAREHPWFDVNWSGRGAYNGTRSRGAGLG
jgi:hypothetical protein